MPAAMIPAPRQSICSSRRSSSIRASRIATSAATATGRLIQKIDRQDHSSRYPPSTGPSAVKAPVTPKNIAIERPRRSGEVDPYTIAMAAGISSAAKTPWAARAVISQVSAHSPVGVAPHSAEVTAKPTTPTWTIRRRPPHVGQPAAQRERRGQRHEVGVDHPLPLIGGQGQVALQLG